MIRSVAILALAVAAFACAGCGGGSEVSACAEPCLEVLFIGNSQTQANDLPAEFERLARSGGANVHAEMLAREGAMLQGHVDTADTTPKIDSRKWDFVILQESTENAAIATARAQSMKPALDRLVPIVRQAGAKPVLFSAPAWQDGFPSGGLARYDGLQAAMISGYREQAEAFGVPVAPVGEAWRRAVAEGYGDRLWAGDRLHAAPLGTYLAACVFYATLTGKSPVGLPYAGTLEQADAAAMQRIAAASVAL